MNGITVTDEDRRFMKMACELARENVDRGGGPFGAVIVRNGEVIATGCNSVPIDNDPMAHAEVNAIRYACRYLRSHNLDGCVIYCSCEPCLMCLSAIYRAGVSCIYYGNTADDTESINFSDRSIDKEINKPYPESAIPCIHIEGTTEHESFGQWCAKEHKIED